MTSPGKIRRRWFLSRAGLLLPMLAAGIAPAQMAVYRRKPAAAGSSYSANATTFAGDTQCNMSINMWASDGNKGIVSFWVKFVDNGTEYILYGSSSAFAIYRDTDNLMKILMKDAAETTLVAANHTTTVSDTNWHHFIASWDRATDNKIAIYLDGASGTNITTFLDTTEDVSPINYSTFTWYMGGVYTTEDLKGCLSEVYINLTEDIDLSVQSNREKWRSSGGSPVNLGSDGSTPTGTAPLGYFKSAYSSFTTNSGSGGNFTKNGTTAFTSCTAPP